MPNGERHSISVYDPIYEAIESEKEKFNKTAIVKITQTQAVEMILKESLKKRGHEFT